MVSRSHTVEALVGSAYRRSLTLLGIEQAALAASLVFAGSVLILLLGTQILDWYWLLLLAVIGLAAGAYRMRKRLPTPYVTAQRLDQRLSLHDTISTAWHINRHPEIAGTAAGRIQLAQAEALVPQIDTRAVFPLRLQRAWLAALALAAVALALFSVRYLVRHDLALSNSLIPIRFDRLSSFMRGAVTGTEHNNAAPSLSQDNDAQSEQSAHTQSIDPRMNDVVGVKNPLSNNATGDKAAAGESLNKPSHDDGLSSEGNSASSGDGKRNESGNPSEAKQPSSKGDAKASEQGNRSPSSSDQENNSLMSRMKDAASSFMAKMKPEESSQSPQASTKNAAAPDQDQSQTESSQSQGQSSSPQSKPSAKSDSNNTAQGQATEMTPAAESRNSGASDRKGGNQSKSGVGKQDGAKEVKEAQDREAMGKLAEIIGKRAHDVSGEMMVEVPSGKQQLKTSYTGKVAEHSDSGGEINRDEIPLALQPYIREYMERIHREAPNSKPAGQ